jgi:hypothetical protein
VQICSYRYIVVYWTISLSLYWIRITLKDIQKYKLTKIIMIKLTSQHNANYPYFDNNSKLIIPLFN